MFVYILFCAFLRSLSGADLRLGIDYTRIDSGWGTDSDNLRICGSGQQHGLVALDGVSTNLFRTLG